MRLLLALGILGGATWIAFAFVPSECAPVTSRSEVYCNRLWTPALFAMTVGFLGMWRWGVARGWRGAGLGLAIVVAGAALMTFGNLLEYWLFYSWPHEGPDAWLRGTLWMMVLLGWLSLLLAAFGAGLLLLLGRRSGPGTMILGAILVTAPCLTVFIGPLAIGVLAIAACLAVLVAQARAPRDRAPEPA